MTGHHQHYFVLLVSERQACKQLQFYCFAPESVGNSGPHGILGPRCNATPFSENNKRDAYHTAPFWSTGLPVATVTQNVFTLTRKVDFHYWIDINYSDLRFHHNPGTTAGSQTHVVPITTRTRFTHFRLKPLCCVGDEGAVNNHQMKFICHYCH